jgi:hypothetical protein
MNSKKTLNVKQAYKIWSEDYDIKDNQTRDLEAIAKLKLKMLHILLFMMRATTRLLSGIFATLFNTQT